MPTLNMDALTKGEIRKLNALKNQWVTTLERKSS